MKFIVALIKLLTYSNLFVATCVAAFTHLTYIIYNLPKDNLAIILIMVFCFTYFTYNMQRIVKFRLTKVDNNEIGERLRWVKKHLLPLTVTSIISGLIGLICTYSININCWLILVPMGGCSFFYVIPLLPFYKKSPTLRQIPFLKIFVIALVWSLVIVGIPFFDTNELSSLMIPNNLLPFIFSSFVVFLFIIGITIPFDIRDISYDNQDELKTIPNVLGIRLSLILAEIFLFTSFLMMYTTINHGATNNGLNNLIGIVIGYLITMIMVWFSSEKRKEIFYSGLIEGSVIVLYFSVIIPTYCPFL